MIPVGPSPIFSIITPNYNSGEKLLATVGSVRATEPAEGVAEVCATLETGRRVRAIAMRLEERQGRWRCTRLQLG